MIRTIFILLGVFIPTALVYGSVASDFIVNNQPIYAVPPGTTKLLILDLTLPSTGLKSIKINNAGTVQQYNLSRLSIYEDGSSPGWDGDESEMVRKSFSPFFDTAIPGDFSKQRIFITVDITSSTYSGKTIKPEIEINSVLFSNSAFNGPTDKKITGFERTILAGADTSSVPLSPLAKSGEALATSTIRWYFTDLSNNEFGFKILDSNLKEVARKEEANLLYLDETGLNPNTEYSGRQVIVFNDRGQSSVTSLTVFPAVKTLPLPAVEMPAPAVEEIEEPAALPETGGPLSPSELRAKIQEIQLQIIDLLQQLINLLQQQLAKAWIFLAGLWITLF